MRTEDTCERVCEQLQLNCGDFMAAAKATGVSLIFLERWRKDDPAIDERMAEAARVGTQGLVSAAIQRAVHGVEEDVYYKGEVVGQQRLYSDGLLTTLLKAKIAEFAREGAPAAVTVNIANMMPRAETYEQWLEMKQKTLAPPGVVIEEAEYTEVLEVAPKRRSFAEVKL